MFVYAWDWFVERWCSNACGFGADYVGCYEDSDDRVFSHQVGVDNAMTPDWCRARCGGYMYFGLQHGNECWCGNTFNLPEKHVRLDEAQCSFPCAGDSSFKCGAAYIMNVYLVGAGEWRRRILSFWKQFIEHKLDTMYVMVWLGMVRFGSVVYGLVWLDISWFGLVWFCSVFYLVLFCLVWFGLVWYGLVGYRMAQTKPKWPTESPPKWIYCVLGPISRPF